ncbi:MAG: competence protein ComEC family protein, partial [Lachnospiraceae bacterium]|nr:competence protein ComEC family protein [Lachnospiraceae bacterium]
MRKRPLASACLLLILFFYLAVSLLPFSPGDQYEGEKRKVKVTGKVYQKEVKQQAGQMVQVLYLKNLSGDSPPGKGALCYLKSGQAEPEMGSIVTVEGSYREFETASNPGQFDSSTYYLISGISYRLSQAMILEKTVGYSKAGEDLYRFKTFLSRKLSENLPEKESALMKTILLGEKGELDREVKELYQRNGIAHILAISGLHVSMLGMGLYHVFRKCGVPMKASALAAAILLLVYGMMTGFSVSALRAILMFFLHMLAVMLERTYDMMTALSVAAVALLIGQPLYLEYSGFVFSFGCVLG